MSRNDVEYVILREYSTLTNLSIISEDNRRAVGLANPLPKKFFSL